MSNDKGIKLEYVYLHNPIFVKGHGSISDSLQASGDGLKKGHEMYLKDDYVWLFLDNRGLKDTVLIPTAQLKHMVLAK